MANTQCGSGQRLMQLLVLMAVCGPCTCWLQVVLRLVLLLDIRTLEELEAFLSRLSSDIEADIDGFLTNQILGLVDFTRVGHGRTA